jgi:hypothetical protein
MRRSALLLPLLFATMAVAACGSTHNTVVAPAGSTIVVPDDGGHTKVITPGG